MTLQLAAWTVPTISPSIEGTVIIREPVTGNLVIMTPAGAFYASAPEGPWVASTGFHASWGFGLNVVTANGVIVAAGTQATPSLSRAVSRSTDGGATWTTTLLETIVTTSSNSVAYDPLNDAFVHYSIGGVTDAQVRESTDNGATWSAPTDITVPAGYDPVGNLIPSGGPANGRIVAANADGTGDGMLYSTDGGYTFLEGTITGDYDRTSYGIALRPEWCTDRWVVGFADGGGVGFLVSLDGETWATVRPASLSAATDQFGALAWNATSGWLYYGNADGAFLSSDFSTFVSVDPVGGVGFSQAAAWDGDVVVQLDQVFSPSANPLRYALASDDGNVTISGLDHLEGMEVSVVNDGVVLASPNNPAYDSVIVTGGTITLTGPLTGTVTVGLPYTTDIQTLDIDAVSTTVKERGLNIGGVIAWIEETGSFYAGPVVPTGDTLTGLERYTPQNDQGYDVTGPVTGVAEVTLQSTYNNSGRVLIRQVDPVPLTILSIAPTGFLNGGR